MAAGELRARPGRQTTPSAAPGFQSLGESARGPALLYVPETAGAGPLPLVLMLHGAGGVAQHSIDLLCPHADKFGFVVLAPTSAEQTWDIIAGHRFGSDSGTIDRLLEQVFSQCMIDPSRLAIAGFSDGASYALSIGLMNGDLFSNVIAFSPGFMAPSRTRGTPEIYISHGTDDDILPIDRCSRRIEAQLRAASYVVDYREFPAGHIVPEPVATAFFSALVHEDPWAPSSLDRL
ncbi:MAG TPA: PHB depolymerase family esterase [Sphingomicrobium sp.]